MRIISDDNSKDYYDCVQAQGQDRSVVYLRNPEEVKIPHQDWHFPKFHHGWYAATIKHYIIGFCGRIYPLVELSYEDYPDPKTKTVRCFTADEVHAFMDAHLKSRKLKIYCREKRSGWGWRAEINKKEVEKFFKECAEQQGNFAKMFDEKRCPVFVAEYSTSRSNGQLFAGNITYNAKLRPFEFFKVFDPFTAFQEISMFMGNIAMPDKVMPIIPDELKIHSRGFNEWSFRAPPLGTKNI